ncbi:ABC transporter substrate-binding protein [Ferriphaselus sp. R-1]|uniref:MlaC/ttg2D family ABC transporter substrate-binding protein n=1 Tax=Ferriphaselus sp. R-1 TaxID=1485544 RepID=UPI0005576783|nr:ABC transporter substrate-binding protein [Ferriphaselus sp. R-1]
MKKLMAMVLGLWLAGAAAWAQAEEFKAPDALIRDVVNEVLEAISKDQALHNGDKQKVQALVETKILPQFDFTRLTQKTIGGKSWRAATPEQRTSLTSEYRSFLVRFYTKAFTSYQDQKVEIKPLKQAPVDDEVTVRSLISKPGAQPVMVDYDLYKTASGWKVYDVSIQEISLVATYKKQFAEKIEQSGIDGLIQWLKDNNQAASKKAGAK